MAAEETPDWFTKATTRFTQAVGHPVSIFSAILLIVVWMIGAVFVGFGNDTYQLLINTITTIITFIMVFVIQATTNRDTKAMNAKLDAIIHYVDSLPNEFEGIEQLGEKAVDEKRKTLEEA